MNDTADVMTLVGLWSDVAFSGDSTWMAKSIDEKSIDSIGGKRVPTALHNTSFGEYTETATGLVEISRLNSNLDFVVFQYIDGVDYMAVDFGRDVKMSADGTMLTISAPSTDKGNGVLFVFCRDELSQTFAFQQRLNSEEERDYFGRLVSITPDGLVMVASSLGWTGIGSLYVFSRNFSECYFSLVQKVEDQLMDCVNLNFALSADGMTLIYGSACSSSSFGGKNAVYIYSRKSRIDEFYLQQRLDGKEGEYFGYQLDVSSCGNVLVISAPYASPEPFLNAGSLHVFIRGKDGNFTHGNQIDGVCDHQNLGYHSVSLHSTDTSLFIQSLSRLPCDISEGLDPSVFRSFLLVCKCSNREYECSRFSKFPDLVCRDIL